MTLNVWNYSPPWPIRRQLIADLIQTHQPDVVALQETRHDVRFEGGRGQGEQVAALTGYRATSAVAQVYVPVLRVDEGLTVLSKFPPGRVMVRQLSRDPHQRADENRRICLGVRLDVSGAEFDVYNTHFSLSASARVANALETARFVRQESGGRPAALMGDLNAEPESLPVRFLLGQQEIAGESGVFCDCWAAAHPDDPGFTYASFNPRQRIDYVLTQNLTGQVRSVELVGTEAVRGVYPSDHLGILAELEL